MKKTGKFLGCFLPIIVALICQVSVSIFYSLGYGIYAAVKMTALGITDAAEQEAYLMESMYSADSMMLLTAVATVGTLLIGALWYRAHKPAADWKLKEVLNGRLIAAMVCLGLSLQFLISMCLNAVYPILPQSLTDQYNELMETLLGGNIWLSLVVTVILAPLAEEFLFRGITLKKSAEDYAVYGCQYSAGSFIRCVSYESGAGRVCLCAGSDFRIYGRIFPFHLGGNFTARLCQWFRRGIIPSSGGSIRDLDWCGLCGPC